MSGQSKQAMDTAIQLHGAAVESIEERQARMRLWDKVKAHTRHTVEQVMGLITGLIDRHDREEMAEILHFSCEYTAALLADEPLDEKAVWEGYDNSRRLLDIATMIPYQWEKLLKEASAWREKPPKYSNEPRVKPLGREDFERLKQMPKKHLLHIQEPSWLQPKYKIAS